MKKLILIVFALFLTTFISCKSLPTSKNNSDIDLLVASELSKMDNNYSDETLKAMSVVLRTNLSINKQNNVKPQVNKKYLNLTNSTKNEVINNSNGNLVEIAFESNDDYSWQKSIKKSKLLEFALKNNISLTNLSKINPIMNGNKVSGIEIGNKYFDYEFLADKFKLESNIINNITQTKTDIVICGKNKGFYGYFDTQKSEQLSNNNYLYSDILSEFFDNLTLIKK